MQRTTLKRVFNLLQRNLHRVFAKPTSAPSLIANIAWKPLYGGNNAWNEPRRGCSLTSIDRNEGTFANFQPCGTESTLVCFFPRAQTILALISCGPSDISDSELFLSTLDCSFSFIAFQFCYLISTSVLCTFLDCCLGCEEDSPNEDKWINRSDDFSLPLHLSLVDTGVDVVGNTIRTKPHGTRDASVILSENHAGLLRTTEHTRLVKRIRPNPLPLQNSFTYCFFVVMQHLSGRCVRSGRVASFVLLLCSIETCL